LEGPSLNHVHRRVGAEISRKVVFGNRISLHKNDERAEIYRGISAPTRALLSEAQHGIEKRLQGVTDIRVSTVPALDAQARKPKVAPRFD